MKIRNLWLCGLLIGAGVPLEARIITAAPGGQAGAAGTIGQPTTLAAALSSAAAGDTILLRAGIYASKEQITIARDNAGAAGKPKSLFAYPGEKPVLDFSSQPYGASGNPRGLQIDGSYWHIRGLEVVGSADNGIYVAGSHNIVEACILHGNRDSGLQIGRWKAEAPRTEWPSDNLILNCESYDNHDLPPGSGENADGFACKLTSGPGNVFRGCISHHNIDDGWDLYTKPETGPIDPVVIDQCIAYSNGVLTDGTSNANGDRNGFKLGGAKIAVAHVVTRCAAFANGKNGFTWNSNPGAIRMSNNLSIDNAEGNFNFGDNSTPTAAVFTNNVSFWTAPSKAQSDKHIGIDAANSNCWWDKSKAPYSINGRGLVVTAADFAASLANPKVARRADGAPDMSAFGLSKGSKLIDAGVLPAGDLPFAADRYYRGAPDLGAVEDGAGVPTVVVPILRKASSGRKVGNPVWLISDGNPGRGMLDIAGRRIPAASRVFP